MRKYKVKRYQKKALRFMLPPEDLTVSEWAEKHRVLDGHSSAIPGSWHNSITPYLVGIMDELNNPDTEEIIFVKPTQVGGTEALNNMLGYVICQDPSPAMIVDPTDILAESIAENRLRPMFRLSPAIKQRYREKNSSKLEHQFEGMYLSLCGANSPSSLASKPIRFLFLDEVDKYPGASKKEADPIKLARERTKTFSNRKIFITSTPTLKTGHIWKAKESADSEKHYFVPCPHCGEYIELIFSNLHFVKDEKLSYADRAETACYCCQECGGIITDRHKPNMLRYGCWETVRAATSEPRKVAYWINTLYSPFVRFAEVAKEFLTTHKDPELFQNFVNSWLAEPWMPTKLITSAELVLERQTELEEFVVPENTLLLTGGVDVQQDSFYWTIRAWGKHFTSQNIAHGQALSLTQISDIMNSTYYKSNGTSTMVNLCLIDSGDQTDMIYEFCALNSEWAMPVKGASHTNNLNHFRISTIDKVGNSANGMQLILVDGNKYKDIIASRMSRKNGQGSWMVHKDCDLDYANQITAEHKITEKRASGTVDVWVTKTSKADNHYLDTEVYAFAAADILGVRQLHLLEEPQQTVQYDDKPETPELNWINGNESWV